MHKTNRYARKFLKKKVRPEIQRSEKSYKSKSQRNHKKIRHIEEELDEEMENFLMEEEYADY